MNKDTHAQEVDTLADALTDTRSRADDEKSSTYLDNGDARSIINHVDECHELLWAVVIGENDAEWRTRVRVLLENYRRKV